MRSAPPSRSGTIADQITFATVRRRAAAFGAALRDQPGRGRAGVVVGHDARFLASRFAEQAAGALAAAGVPVLFAAGPLPAAAIAHAIGSGRRAGGLYVSGGDLPAEESGVTLYDATGAPAADDLMERVDRQVVEEATDPSGSGRRRSATWRRFRPRAAYLASLLRAVPVARIRRARLRLACDARHGAAAGWLGEALGRITAAIEEHHADPRPDFGGLAPTCGEHDLAPLGRLVRRARRHLGLATDADGTHCGAVDERGAPIPPGALAALIADRLLVEGRVRGGLARSVAATHLIDDVAAARGRTTLEVPFGAAPLAAALGSPAGMAIDEAGGIALRGHARERDGILAALLASEAAAIGRRPLRDQISDLQRRLGPRLGRRIDYHVDAAARARALQRLRDVPARFAGRPVRAVAASESRKWLLADGSWVLFRAAAEDGPLRCHLEARSARDLEALTAAAREWVAGGS